MPKELSKTALPKYTIEPPDILLIEAITLNPKAPYALRTNDVLYLEVEGALPDAPITGLFVVEVGGVVNLGIPYGSVQIAGMTVPQAKQAMEAYLKSHVINPVVFASISQLAGQQQIAGEHLVGPDGSVNLGSYGSVQIVGQTTDQAKFTIEQHLSQYLDAPEVAVNVYAYNSKVYYIITEGAGLGDGVYRFPITGNETVLDAISNINGLSEVSSSRIWVARPSPHAGDVQIMPVDWKAITAQGSTTTNYQLMPGDRLFVAEDKYVRFDTTIAKFTAPLERIMGFSLLGAGTATRFSGRVLQGGGDQRVR